MAIIAYIYLLKTRLNFIARIMDFEVIIEISKIGKETKILESKS